MNNYSAHIHGTSATISNEFGTIAGTIYNGSEIVFRDHHANLSPTVVTIDSFTTEAIEEWANTNLDSLLD